MGRIQGVRREGPIRNLVTTVRHNTPKPAGLVEVQLLDPRGRGCCVGNSI